MKKKLLVPYQITYRLCIPPTDPYLKRSCTAYSGGSTCIGWGQLPPQVEFFFTLTYLVIFSFAPTQKKNDVAPVR